MGKFREQDTTFYGGDPQIIINKELGDQDRALQVLVDQYREVYRLLGSGRLDQVSQTRAQQYLNTIACLLGGPPF